MCLPHLSRVRLGSMVVLAGLVALLSIELTSAAEPSCSAGPERAGRSISGTACDDVILVPPGVENVYAGEGDDVVKSNGDGTVIYGQEGDDIVYGGESERLTTLPSRARQAKYHPSQQTATASDTCPTPDPDTCYGGLYGDTIFGGGGNDKIFGERGNDHLFGGAQDDLLYGGIGDDEVNGELGNDMVAGGYGGDTIDGGANDDFARGDPSQDKIFDSGSATTDTLSFSTALTPGFSDTLAYDLPPANGERGVNVNLDSTPFQTAQNRDSRWGGGKDVEITAGNFEVIIGSPFSDYIVGSSGGETIYGGGGADVILGGGGNDNIFGGADGDHLDGGTETNNLYPENGNDFCINPTTTGCERNQSNDANGGVVLRNSSAIAVGLMTDGSSISFAELYLVGSSGADAVVIDYSGAETSPTVTMTASSGQFDMSQAPIAGCPTYTATSVVCTPGKRLISITAAGMAGSDFVSVAEFDGSGNPVSNVPTFSSVFTTGGEGGDWLVGGQSSEDSLIDGPDFAGVSSDTLQSYGHDDALTNNEGKDTLAGGDGNDLLLSALVCEDNSLGGGPGADNASFARLESGSVEARVAEEKAGRPSAGGPSCSSDVLKDEMPGIDDLEGSNNNDKLFGHGIRNLLIGRSGEDSFNSRDGADEIWANSDDVDASIDCNAGGGDVAIRDYPAFANDPPRQGCETDKGDFPIYDDSDSGD